MSETTEASAAFERWQARWTPEAVHERETKERDRARAEREQQRAAAGQAELTLGALLSKLGFSDEYAQHLVQPYCRCECGHDGWEFCEHANDLGWPSRDWGL